MAILSLLTVACMLEPRSSPMASEATDYTGFWKTSCSTGFGLRIQREAGKLYSISFCGPGGCFAPGEWTPNTSIEGDPKYRVVSANELAVQGQDGAYSTYIQCDDDPTWLTTPPSLSGTKLESFAQEDDLDCPSKTGAENGVLIAWITDVRTTTQFGATTERTTTTVQPFRAVAFFHGAILEATDGASISSGQAFWPVLDPRPTPRRLTSVDSFVDHMGEDHCVYFGSLDAELPTGTLLSSAPLQDRFREPTDSDRTALSRIDSSCVAQGDSPENEPPPSCVRPSLLAVSDLDENGMPEYWVKQPYRWDNGLTVWELGASPVQLLAVCVGCSD